MLEIGDSKTYTAGNTWPATLTADLNAADAGVATWRSDNIGAAASGASYWAANIGAKLAAQPDYHGVVLINIGVNDFVSATQVQWVADMGTMLDAIHSKWPQATLYLMRPWKRGYDAKADEFVGWIDMLIAGRSFLRSGPDERVWLKGSDDGNTMTTDGVHYSVAGEAACAAQWLGTLH
jgi:hypothetical protein